MKSGLEQGSVTGIYFNYPKRLVRLLARFFPRLANKAACQNFSAHLYLKAKEIAPPEGEYIKLTLAGACCVLEEIVAPSDRSLRVISKDVELLRQDQIAELFHATVWTLVAMFLSQHRESEDNWIMLCGEVVGALDSESDFPEKIWPGLETGAFPSVAIALHSRYKEILDCSGLQDAGFILLQIKLLAAFTSITREYYAISRPR